MESTYVSPIGRHIEKTELFNTPELLRGMSLHDITTQYGTEGLYTRLQDVLLAHGLHEDETIRAALHLGLRLHQHDTRTNGHYGDHLLRVTLRIIEQYHITDTGIISAALLHDSLEDHALDIVHMVGEDPSEMDVERVRSVARGVLSLIVGPSVTEIINDVTNDPLPSGADKNRAYFMKTLKTVAFSPKGRVIKLSDFTDNAIGNHYTEGPLKLKLDRKYVGCYAIHATGLYLPDSLIAQELRPGLARKISLGFNRTQQRLAMSAL